MTPAATARVRPTAPDEREAGCPECDGSLERDAAETYCGDCGLLVEAPQLDYRNTRMLRADHDTDPRPRQRATDTRHDGGLTTQIGHPGESYGLANIRTRDFGRLLWQHERSRAKDKHERVRRWAFGEIQRLVAGLELPAVVRRTACRWFKRFHDAGHLQGRTYEVYATAFVYAAARCHRYPTTMHDLDDLARADRKRVWRGLSVVKQTLGLSLPPLQAAELVPRVCSAVAYDLNPDQRERALALARLVDGAVGVENAPHGLAGAAVYLGADGRMNGEVTQAGVAEAAGCMRATLRSGMQAIEGVQDRGTGEGELAADGGVPSDDDPELVTDGGVDSDGAGREREWPPTFDVQLDDRKQAVMNCFELMERLADEYGGTGQIRKVRDGRLSVELHYDIPETSDTKDTGGDP